MHLTTIELTALFPTPRSNTPPLDSASAAKIRLAALEDAAWNYRSALLSYVVALNALESGYRSWPIINLYYSVFYSLRSILYSNNICLYHCEQKPMLIEISPGNFPVLQSFKGAGNSHRAAKVIFQRAFPNHPLNGQIDFEDAIDWMKSVRELVNYNDPTMNLDDRLGFLRKIDKGGIRSTLNTYNEDTRLYAFLPEDAMLAFPLYSLQACKNSINPGSAVVIKGQVDELIGRIRDKNGPIPIAQQFSL